jgi:NAD dependent epimerase/dehydratase family enzyme
VAPEPVTNREFSGTLAGTLSRPHFAPAVPAFALKLAMGEMASLLLTSQHVVPGKLNRLGFTWTAGSLITSLERCVKR